MTGPMERPNATPTTVRLRVTRVECDTCHQVQDFTHPEGTDAHLALNAVLGGQGWKKDGRVHTCRDCQQATQITTVRLTDAELAEAARLTENGDGDLVSDEAVSALISEVRAARTEIRALNQDLAAKRSDFDAAVRKISELRDEVDDFHAACKSTCEQRDAALEQLTAIRDLATRWARQAPTSRDAYQQIDDGCALLRVLDRTATVAEVSEATEPAIGATLQCGRCGVSDRHLAEVTAERDALRAKVADYSRYVTDLEAERDALRARPAQARIDAEDASAKVRVLADRVAELEAAQRESVGYAALVQANGATQVIPMDLTRVQAERCAEWHNGISPNGARVVELLETGQRGRPV